jgi:hypothetical protein
VVEVERDIKLQGKVLVETRGNQLCHYDFVVVQLVATCLNKSVSASTIGKCDVWQNNTQTPILVLPHIHVQLCMVRSRGPNTVPWAGTVE